MSDDFSDFSLLQLFRVEAENQAEVLTAGLLELERTPTAAEPLESCMRAAHSLKGAARIVDQNAGVRVAHAMEDCFVAAQRGELILTAAHVDALLNGTDLLLRIAQTPEAEMTQWEGAKQPEVDTLVARLAFGARPTTDAALTETSFSAPLRIAAPVRAPDPEARTPVSNAHGREPADRVLRITADNLNRLLALAGESLVESRWLKPFSGSLLRLKRAQDQLAHSLEHFRELLPEMAADERLQAAHADLHRQVIDCRRLTVERLVEVEMFERRSTHLAHRLYDEALAGRMRPLADSLHGFPRLVRDLARELGKEARLEIVGETTSVDRDVLEQLEAPLGHMLRNALDHGIESPADRQAAGKPREGRIRIEAHHTAGLLQIAVSDDGRGIDLDHLRGAIVTRALTTAETAAQLSETELLEFLFLPGFTMKETVTEISGRGVGLDVVHAMVKRVRGTVRITLQPGQGARFLLQLPLTLSVVRTLLVEIAGEPYAFPLAYIVRTLKVPRDKLELLEGRQHFPFEGRPIGLVTAHQVLGQGAGDPGSSEMPVIMIGGANGHFGLVVDRFLGERELVVQPLDPGLGKIKDILAAALMENGAPVLIVDVEDLTRSVEKLIASGRLSRVHDVLGTGETRARRKRVLVVDDSLTVRELERKLLGHRGYDVDVAVDGMDGWNAVRSGDFNLVITDIDMPRLDGIELVALIKKDPRLKAIPVMIVSYKDREEDRRRGLEAGADYYLTKGSFHDETLLQAVVDLIGEPTT